MSTDGHHLHTIRPLAPTTTTINTNDHITTSTTIRAYLLIRKRLHCAREGRADEHDQHAGLAEGVAIQKAEALIGALQVGFVPRPEDVRRFPSEYHLILGAHAERIDGLSLPRAEWGLETDALCTAVQQCERAANKWERIAVRHDQSNNSHLLVRSGTNTIGSSLSTGFERGVGLRPPPRSAAVRRWAR